MQREARAAVYDEKLGVEAYRLEGFVRPFPKHFHEYYVIGCVERGRRVLSCRNQKCTVADGSVLLLNPGDSHACVQSGAGALDYRGLNVDPSSMQNWAEEIAGKRELPEFACAALREPHLAAGFRALHDRVMGGAEDVAKQESLLILLSTILLGFGGPAERDLPPCGPEIKRACEYMESHYASRVSLDEICRCAGMGKSTLLRAFAKSKGVTPYRYLESVRVSEAQKRLRRGASALDAALQTGFSDQSHFTNCFSRLTGLTPGAYRGLFHSGKPIRDEHDFERRKERT